MGFPFFRNRPPPGMEYDAAACHWGWSQPAAKATVKLSAGGKKGAAAAVAVGSGANLKKPRLAPMAVPQPKIPSAAAMAKGGDILGGRLPEVPEDLHNDMVALASKGEIPVTAPKQREGYATRRPSFYGDPIFRDALRFGYIHPTHATAPRGMKWKSVRAGAF